MPLFVYEETKRRRDEEKKKRRKESFPPALRIAFPDLVVASGARP
jgi:hypothetical protein